MLTWIREHKFEAHLTAFLMMVIPAAGMIFSARNAADNLTWVWLILFVMGNLLAMVIR
ncbi:MAG: hypothetical protein HN413_02555 [Chloroflexi bacterium]|jgi:hypothetical protein|nr:hypothetical protein [Chloroflexota bacterium]